MKRIIILLGPLLTGYCMMAQNVGIGITNPKTWPSFMFIEVIPDH